MPVSVPARVFDPKRLAAVRATGLLDTAAEEPFDRLATLAATLLDAPFAFITIVDDTRSFWKSCIGVDADDPADRQNTVEESFCQYVIGSREPLIIGDAARDERTRDNPSIKSMGVAAWAGFPLMAPTGEVLGTFCVVDQRVREWTDRDVEVLRTMAFAAAGEVSLRAALRTAAGEAERSATLARTLQQSLLPPRMPDVPHLDLAARYRPAGDGVDVLGDFYDVFEATGEGWNVVIGDVCGKGAQAARVTGLARWTIRASAMRETAPSEVLRQLNDSLLSQPVEEQLHLTALLASLRPGPGGVTGTLSSAGHELALIRRATGRVEAVAISGTLLGVFPEVDLDDVNLRLAPGDQLVLYTDGVVEARHDGELYGSERLASLIEETEGDADAVAEAVAQAAREWSGQELRDDVGVLVVGVPL